MLEGKKILIAITGSIAAYKSILLVRLLVKAGAEVKVIITPAAKDFVSVLTLETLSKNPVISDLFREGTWSNHVMLGRWADAMIIAPLSCNTLAKMSHGLCDNMVLATYLSATCPVIAVPAMDDDMWNHPATKENLNRISGFGNLVIPAEKGELASGLVGDGRMAEPETILEFLGAEVFNSKDLAGKKIIVTAGPTYESLDPVRFIGNHSSGKMGISISNELAKRGAEVTLILGPVNGTKVGPGVQVERVKTAEEMYQLCVEQFPESEIAVMSAAVADYTPKNVMNSKIKKNSDTLTLELTKTKDILKSLGQIKQPNQLLVGFALETDNERESALNKLRSKNADMIVLNSLNEEGAGFGHDTNKVTIFEKDVGLNE